MINGGTYEGEWKNGMRDGAGKYVKLFLFLSIVIQVWPDKSYYDGEWVKDKAWGKGKLVHIDGDTYDGEWVDDTANGFGIYIHSGIDLFI